MMRMLTRILGLLTHARQRFVAYCFAGRFELVAEGSPLSSLRSQLFRAARWLSALNTFAQRGGSPLSALRSPLSVLNSFAQRGCISHCFLLLLLLPCVVFAEATPTWTNRAGQALEATPIALEANAEKVRFRLPSGSEVAYPLSIFSEGEQLRLRLALGEVPVPPELVEPWDFASAGIVRTKALLNAGYTTEEKAEKQIAAFRTVLLSAIDKLPDLTPEYRAALRAKASAL